MPYPPELHRSECWSIRLRRGLETQLYRAVHPRIRLIGCALYEIVNCDPKSPKAQSKAHRVAHPMRPVFYITLDL